MRKKVIVNSDVYFLSEYVKKYEFGPINLLCREDADEQSFFFVIDVLKNYGTKKFFPKVYRKEFFSLNPSFEDTSEIVCDEELLIEDLRFDYEEFYDESIDLVLDKVIQKITDDFK